MTQQRIDVAALPALKISEETFGALPDLTHANRPPEKDGTTWKIRLMNEPSAPYVICRYVGFRNSPGCCIEMLRPQVSASLGAKWHPKMGKGKRA